MHSIIAAFKDIKQNKVSALEYERIQIIYVILEFVWNIEAFSVIYWLCFRTDNQVWVDMVEFQ